MNTQILMPNRQGIAKASRMLKKGGLVAIPTETVYGLAADALNPTAVKNIFKAKGRPSDNPLIIHASSFNTIYPLVKYIPDKAIMLANHFWPGPLTMIMEKSDLVPPETSGGLDSVAIRIPSCEATIRLMEESGLFLAAPSANTSGKPSPTCAEHVINDLDGKIDAIIDGGTCMVGIESTVITLLDNKVTLLRPGFVTVEQLQSVIGKVIIDSAVTEKPVKGKKVLSPGIKYKHYAPSANVILVKSNKDDYINFVNSFYSKDEYEYFLALCYDSEKDFIKIKTMIFGEENNYNLLAQKLFSLLRSIDKTNVKTVYVHSPEEKGIGFAVYNRLIRAAGFEVIKIENGKTI